MAHGAMGLGKLVQGGAGVHGWGQVRGSWSPERWRDSRAWCHRNQRRLSQEGMSAGWGNGAFRESGDTWRGGIVGTDAGWEEWCGQQGPL